MHPAVVPPVLLVLQLAHVCEPAPDIQRALQAAAVEVSDAMDFDRAPLQENRRTDPSNAPCF